MLLNGLERGEPTCAGLCDLEPRFSTLGEHVKGVPWVIGLCTVKLPKLAEVEDTELIPAGLQTEDVMFRGLQTAGEILQRKWPSSFHSRWCEQALEILHV